MSRRAGACRDQIWVEGTAVVPGEVGCKIIGDFGAALYPKTVLGAAALAAAFLKWGAFEDGNARITLGRGDGKTRDGTPGDAASGRDHLETLFAH